MTNDLLMFKTLFAQSNSEMVSSLEIAEDIDDVRCSSNGFSLDRTSSKRTQSLIGLFCIFNHQNIHLVRRFINARSADQVLKSIRELQSQWLVDIDVVDGKVVLSGFGPLLSSDVVAFLKVAFPTGKIKLHGRIYQLFESS